MNETKKKILDTAERLFGEQGYSETSLRRIISEAGVNLAAIHYHFGSKQDLLDAVILRKAGPLNEQRLGLLDRLEAESAPESVPVDRILEAIIEPAILIEKSPEFLRLMGRLHTEGLMPAIAQRHFQPMIARFYSALCRALPKISHKELIWRAHFAIGAMAYTMASQPERSSGGGAVSPLHVSRMLVSFLASGFRAPAIMDQESEVNQ
jgi:AcrR family transcriptional regulator